MSDRIIIPRDKIHTLVFDFDGVFTDNKVWVDQDGRESVRCDRSDGLAFDMLRRYQRKTGWSCQYFILSKESNSVVFARANKLKIDCKFGVKDKLEYLIEYFSDNPGGVESAFRGLAYLGNDVNDIPVMRRAGFPVAPSDAHVMVREVAVRVYPQKGGEGFVRAFIEDLLGIDRMRKEELDEFISDC